jgi:hypothetical protein
MAIVGMEFRAETVHSRMAARKQALMQQPAAQFLRHVMKELANPTRISPLARY